ncbi:MAG: twin-arginine translocase TatA/TatE family subunit [Dehalococcoidia bacterium]|nr:twin-arginine translocase TatA/TatE family subunit [Dehalococcoidia bacterium]
MPFNIGPMELIILLVLVLVIFGVGRLPEVGGAIGKSLREFKKSTRELDDDNPKEQVQKEQHT